MQQFDRTDAAFYDFIAKGTPGDVDFYLDEIRKTGSPVLELGCGTGRVMIPVAEAAHDVVGLDRAPAMLEIARTKVAKLREDVRARIQIVAGDMRDIALGRRFKMVLIPYGAFMHLMTIEHQRAALISVRDHLEDDGLLVFNIFDPNLEGIAAGSSYSGQALNRLAEFEDPETQNKTVVWETRNFDLERQVVSIYRIFEELDDNGVVRKKTYTPLELRWSYRYEMQHLLELCGLEVDALYGDFDRGPYKPGVEQVWVARAAS